MALLLADVLLGLILEDDDLPALAVLDDFRLGANALNIGLADRYSITIGDHQHVEIDGFANLGIELFNEDLVALLDLVLLAAGNDNSVHGKFLLIDLARSFGVRFEAQLRTDSERLTELCYHFPGPMSSIFC